jgi:MerR family transcriptional regulator, thiopeptide resistance regulator
MQAGCAPESEDVMDIAERARLSIDRWFYPCSRQMHARLADLYEADERFAANYERRAAGLTAFFATAIRANARRG